MATGCDYLFNIVISAQQRGMGEMTKLVYTFCKRVFKDFILQSLEYKQPHFIIKLNGLNIGILFWNTPECEMDTALSESYYKWAHGIILVYDVLYDGSLDEVLLLIDSIRCCTGEEKKIIVIADSCDGPIMRSEAAKKIVNANHIPYFEVCSISSKEIEYAFIYLISMILESHLRKEKRTLPIKQEIPKEESRRRVYKCIII